MTSPFVKRPILNSSYEEARRHWELDAEGQPTQKVIENRRRAEFITPIPTPDLGQRIFQQPFSWKALGVDIRGRSRTLHVNYRTSHRIRMQAISPDGVMS